MSVDRIPRRIVTELARSRGSGQRLKKTGPSPFDPEYTHFDLQIRGEAATDASYAVLWRESCRPYGRPRAKARNQDWSAFADGRGSSAKDKVDSGWDLI